MSVAKLETVQRAAKDQGKCEKCGDALPKGAPYRWYVVGFRSHWKHRRCMKPSCTPRPSERESSLVASVMAAQEDAEAQLSQLDALADAGETVQAVKDALANVSESIDDVVSQYREQDEQFGGGGNTDSAQRADDLESAKDTLDGWEPDAEEPDGCDVHSPAMEGCPDCDTKREDWLADVVSSAQDALAEVGV